VAAQVGKQRYGAAEYGAAIAAVADVEQCTDGTPEELAEALRWRAEAKAANGDTQGSIDTWALLNVIMPTYVLDPLESPKFREMFAQGRARSERSKLVFARLVKAQPGSLEVQVFDPNGRVKRVTVMVDGHDVAVTPRGDGHSSISLRPGAATAVVDLESGDAVLFRSGKIKVSALAPIAVAEPSRPSVPPAALKSAPEPFTVPVWAVVAGGVVVAAIIVGVVVGAAQGSKKIEGSLGTVQLPLEGRPDSP
jgi:hypothetical protein